jgi:hypothetical protein
MKTFVVLLFPAILNAYSPTINDSAQANDHKIAQVVRSAVRQADAAILNVNAFSVWRDYLKIAALDLDPMLQPLLLIKYDEDISFRNQLKTLLDWESKFQRKETENYLYYYRLDQPPPEIILQIQDAHFNELTRLFKIKATEKIPYRYDLNAGEGAVYPYNDLRAGVISSQPIDLEKCALAIFNFINAETIFLLRPLSKIYGSYFQNLATSQAYQEKCWREIERSGYVGAETLLQLKKLANLSSPEWFSSYAFVFELSQEFGAVKIAQLLARLDGETSVGEFRAAFQEIFEISLSEFEKRFVVENNDQKL